MAQVADHLSVSALEEKDRSCTDVTAARHVQAIWLLAKGHNIAEVSATVLYARRWVERLLARDKAEGLDALGDLRRRNGTRPSVLKPELLDKLKARLCAPPPDGGLWTRSKVAAWMAGELGRRTRACRGLTPPWLGGAEGDRRVGAEAPPAPSCLGHAGGARGV